MTPQARGTVEMTVAMLILGTIGYFVLRSGQPVMDVVQTRPGASCAGSDYDLGIAMALGAACFWAVAAIITKKVTSTPPQLIAFIQVCVGIVMVAPFANLTELPRGGEAWGSLLTMGVVHTGLMYMLMYGAVLKLPTYLQGALSFVYPVAAIAVDRFALGHQLQATQLVGVVAILCAAAGINLGWAARSVRSR
jgi:drug/metabolite transporter (DMT)-like permease